MPGRCAIETPNGFDGTELEVLRAGIRLMALRALGNSEIAEEVAQETLVRAFHALRTSRPERLGPFVAGIARHVIADIIRAKPREVSLDALTPDSEAQAGPDPLVALCEESERVRVQEALAQLAPNDRDVLRLSFFEGLSPTEIARRLGTPPERIRQRKLRALARLREAFDGAGERTSSRHADAAAPTIKQMPAGVVGTSRSLK